MKRNIIILSNRGFIGSYIYADLIKKSKYDIIGLNSKNCDLLNYNNTKKTFSKFGNKKITIIFLSTYGRIPADDFSVYEKNIAMINNFIKSVKHINVEQVIFFSSTCLYGRPPISIPINESKISLQNGYYGMSKYFSEELLKLSFNCPLCIIRVPGVYGVNDNNKSVISSFINQIFYNKKINLYDGGEVLRDYVYVNDIVKIIKICIDKKISDTFNFSTGKSYKIKEIINIIQKKFHKKAQLTNIKTNHLQFDLKFDVRKFNKLFPNFKVTDLKKGINEIIKQKYK